MTNYVGLPNGEIKAVLGDSDAKVGEERVIMNVAELYYRNMMNVCIKL